MNLIKNVISGKMVKTFLPVALGGTGVGLGSAAVFKNNEQLKILNSQNNQKEEYNNLITFVKEENQKHWDKHFKKELETQETLEGLTAQIRGILDTKNIEVDLSPIIQKLEAILENQKTPVLETKIVETDLTPIIKKIDANHEALISWIEENLQVITDNFTTVSNQITDNYNDNMEALEIIGNGLDVKIGAVLTNFEDNNEINYKNLQIINQGLIDMEKEIWTLSNDVGLWTEMVKNDLSDILKSVKNDLIGQIINIKK